MKVEEKPEHAEKSFEGQERTNGLSSTMVICGNLKMVICGNLNSHPHAIFHEMSATAL
jgi:hypothetical protein